MWRIVIRAPHQAANWMDYPLKETPSTEYDQRTEWNARDSDGTVVFSIVETLTGGSKETVEFARKHGKPVVHLSRSGPASPELALLSLTLCRGQLPAVVIPHHRFRIQAEATARLRLNGHSGRGVLVNTWPLPSSTRVESVTRGNYLLRVIGWWGVPYEKAYGARVVEKHRRTPAQKNCAD